MKNYLLDLRTLGRLKIEAPRTNDKPAKKIDVTKKLRSPRCKMPKVKKIHPSTIIHTAWVFSLLMLGTDLRLTYSNELIITRTGRTNRLIEIAFIG
jgi:hypothetical protein